MMAMVCWQFFAVCFLLLVVLLLLTICFWRSRRRSRRNIEPPFSSSSHLLSNQQIEEEQQQKQEQEENEYKQDAWFACLSTPVAYRYMNDPKSKEKIRIPPQTTRIHLIILVHGWNGRPCSLGYMKDALERQTAVAVVASINNDTHSFIIHSATANQNQTSDGVAAGGYRLAQEVEDIIQNIQQHWLTNNSRSSSSNKNKQQEQLFLSVSFVGHSLGGLYARYAISKIPSLQKSTTTAQHDAVSFKTSDEGRSKGSGLMDIIIEPGIFCTTCSPHLGLANELLYIPNVPRWLQYIIACTFIKQTGQDLFRFNKLLEKMVFEPFYRNALASFAQRITYVNTFDTDFQVPTQTSAFLARDDNLCHRRQRQEQGSFSTSAAATNNNNKMIALVVETCQRPPTMQQGQQQDQGTITITTTTTSNQHGSSSSNDKTGPMATIAELAAEMDALGWTKVFCDVRDVIQSYPRWSSSCNHSSCNNNSSSTIAATPTPTTSAAPAPGRSMSAMSSNSSSSASVNDTVDVKDERSKVTSSLDRGGDNKSCENDDDIQLDVKNKCNDRAEAEKDYYTSKELLDQFNTSSKHDDRWYVPSAHLVMVASTKRQFLVERTAAGRPIMDELANRVIQGILQMHESKKSE